MENRINKIEDLLIEENKEIKSQHLASNAGNVEKKIIVKSFSNQDYEIVTQKKTEKDIEQINMFINQENKNFRFHDS